MPVESARLAEHDRNKTGKVLVALSGGADSTAAAIMLIKQGYQVEAVHMLTSDRGVQGLDHIRRITQALGIYLHVLDLRSDFKQVIQYMVDEYRSGRTPNPCIVCNRQIKFGRLWEMARQCGASWLATGHYARILYKGGEPGLYLAADVAKDQSYVLAMIERAMLDRIILSLGQVTKAQARDMAGPLALDFHDSQEICFIPDSSYVQFIERLYPDLIRPGPILDVGGRVIGQHLGVHRYTIGQRRGLGLAMGRPWYVVRLDPKENVVVLGPAEYLHSEGLIATKVNWLIDRPQNQFRALVKVRYNDRGRPALISPEGDKVIVRFDQPAIAVTPGQLAVLYGLDQDPPQVLGGGWIEQALPAGWGSLLCDEGD